MDIDYANNISVLKNRVVRMLAERSERTSVTAIDPSKMWLEACNVFDYIINLTDDNFKKIRLHTAQITGENILGYLHPYPPIDAQRFADFIGYSFFVDQLPESFWISEPSSPEITQSLGVIYNGRIINWDIARYQAVVANLYFSGVFDYLLHQSERALILEVGGGYGGWHTHWEGLYHRRRILSLTCRRCCYFPAATWRCIIRRRRFTSMIVIRSLPILYAME